MYLNALLFAVSLGLGLISYYLLTPNLDSDILWSMAIGKWISLNYTVPVVDSFSWTIYGKEWLTHEWIFSYLAYYSHLALGNWGFYLLAFLPAVVTIYVLYLIGDKLDVHGSYAFIIPMAVGVTLLYKLVIPFRAYLFGLMFFTILIYLLYFKEQGKRVGFYLFLLFVLWANFHVSVCMGILVLMAEMFRRMIISGRLLHPSAIMVLCIAATLINPYIFKIWGYFLFTLTGMGEAKSIAEWQAADFNNLQILFVYLFLAATVIFLHFQYMRLQLSQEMSGSTIRQEATDQNQAVIGRLGLFEYISKLTGKVSARICILMLFWAFYIYSLYSVRMVFYTIILWIIVSSILAGNRDNLNFTKRTHYLFAGVFLLWFVGNIWTCQFKAPDILNYDPKISPVEEVQFFKNNPQYQANLFNEYIYGGYLILNEIPVFIDARSDSYIKFGIQQKYGDAVLLKEDPQQIFDEMQVMNVIIPNHSMLDRYLAVNQRWRLVHRGSSACIYTAVQGIAVQNQSPQY
ncbi:MAG: hypothetical protein VB084_07040 [Syntrophomonadaceae bacterium]|nr:hypothetical protein [Syntrophomonadaceae bacterium]